MGSYPAAFSHMPFIGASPTGKGIGGLMLAGRRLQNFNQQKRGGFHQWAKSGDLMLATG